VSLYRIFLLLLCVPSFFFLDGNKDGKIVVSFGYVFAFFSGYFSLVFFFLLFPWPKYLPTYIPSSRFFGPTKWNLNLGVFSGAGHSYFIRLDHDRTFGDRINTNRFIFSIHDLELFILNLFYP
jgi:hypothetical protein